MFNLVLFSSCFQGFINTFKFISYIGPQPNAFSSFDELKTSLRFIAIMLGKEDKGLERRELNKRMNAQDISQSQLCRTIKVLTEIGLVEESDTMRGNVSSVYTHLIPKGRQVAQLAQKMDRF